MSIYKKLILAITFAAGCSYIQMSTRGAPVSKATHIIKSVEKPRRPAKRDPVSSRQLDEKLQRILRQHPVLSVRKKLSEDIRASDILLSYNSQIPNVDAVFILDRSNGVTNNALPLKDARKVLIINPRRFANESVSDKWWMFVLFHESIHMRQFQEGSLSPEVLDILNWPQNPIRRRKLFKEKWYAKREAYQEECWLAKSLGNTEHMKQLCATVDTERFDRVLAVMLTQAAADQIGRNVYAELGRL